MYTTLLITINIFDKKTIYSILEKSTPFRNSHKARKKVLLIQKQPIDLESLKRLDLNPSGV